MCDTTDFHSDLIPGKIKGGIADTKTLLILFGKGKLKAILLTILFMDIFDWLLNEKKCVYSWFMLLAYLFISV